MVLGPGARQLYLDHYLLVRLPQVQRQIQETQERLQQAQQDYQDAAMAELLARLSDPCQDHEQQRQANLARYHAVLAECYADLDTLKKEHHGLLYEWHLVAHQAPRLTDSQLARIKYYGRTSSDDMTIADYKRHYQVEIKDDAVNLTDERLRQILQELKEVKLESNQEAVAHWQSISPEQFEANHVPPSPVPVIRNDQSMNHAELVGLLCCLLDLDW